MTDLRLFDLNLLVAFDALVAERSVTHAARRVGIGQPAMSHALSRLRELFGDPLFVRTTGKMRPTTRALELAAPIARVLADIRESVLADRAFAPDRAEMTFRVGASDQNELAVLPAVLAALRSSAPKARIVVSAVDRDRLEQELALVLQRLDVDEELDRLAGHIVEIRRIIGGNDPAGRRLDFLMQELNREANTLSSKSQDAEMTRHGVEMKVLIEQMREQVQNIE